ncbi:Exocyst complex component EXO70A1 like [Actinidia chinensis var. chinensis]|uniref:Exocyst subunit Exo70 family protein n=1 Tax=Actinidia chinensis var. chinensis TaxID=1590841 RepID=A0A2R6RNA5_ACTCC|nr:Exocyst complex component EXO70A1 like [Actinidia chinensis var. chinensis]
METREDDSMLIKLESACSDLKNLLQTSISMDSNLEKMGKSFDSFQETLTTGSRRVAHLHSLSIETKALDTRINRAVSPALSLLDSFKLSESLQRKLLDLTSKLSDEKAANKRLKRLKKYVDCVDKLNVAINSISQECEPAIQKLQEVVEFLSRTKATDQYRTLRLRETLVTLKALYETEVDAMKFDGLLDEALMKLQDEFEVLLLQLRHQNLGVAQGSGETAEVPAAASAELGSEMEIEVLRQISETLANNDCLDIVIEIYVKVRYKRAAKALMRLNPDYLRTYTHEEIDEMEWENLETAISLWIHHFELAVKTVLVSEKSLSGQVLGGTMDGLIWQECFVKIADKIMAVFFRFGEGVARSSKEPQKLFKLLDMFYSLEKMKGEFSEVFGGEAGADICLRFRELEKLLVNAACKVFWEFGLQIEGNQDGLPPPADGGIPKLVRYATNYLKYLATDTYSVAMAKVLRTEQIWKAGILSKPESDENLLKNAITSVMEAIQRNVEDKRLRYKDKVLPHILATNTYWYIYMRTRNSELGKLLGEQYMKKRYKIMAEESAYLYQKQAWGSLVGLLDKEEIKKANKEAIGAMVKGKLEAFLNGFNEVAQRHKSSYSIPDGGLRGQIREATVNLVVPAYSEFLSSYGYVLQVKPYLSPEAMEGLLGQIYGGGERVRDGKVVVRRRGSRDQIEETQSGSVERSREMRQFRWPKSKTSDA